MLKGFKRRFSSRSRAREDLETDSYGFILVDEVFRQDTMA
jgi:hypothetical protein